MDNRRTEELIGCILTALHGKVCRIIQYGSSSAHSEAEFAVLTPYKISTDEVTRLSDAVTEFNRKHEKSISVVDIDLDSFLKWKESTPFYQAIDRTGVVLWSE